MKKSVLMLMVFSIAMLSSSFANAQFVPSSQFGLPEGAIARFGRGGINEIMYSRDGTQLAVTTNIGVWIYATHTGEELKLLAGEHSHFVYSADYSPDGKTIVTGSWDNTIRLWDVRTGKNRKTLKRHSYYGISSVAYSPDGKTIASGGADKTLQLWNARTGKNKKTLTDDGEGVNSVKFSPDGKTIASIEGKNSVRLWNARTGYNIITFNPHTEYIYSIAYSPDSKTIAIGGMETLELWDVATAEPLRRINAHKDRVSFLWHFLQMEKQSQRVAETPCYGCGMLLLLNL